MASLFGLLAGVLFGFSLLMGSQALRRLNLPVAFGLGQAGALVVLLLVTAIAGAPIIPEWGPGVAALVASGVIAAGFGRMSALSGAHRLGAARSGTVQASVYPLTAMLLALTFLGQAVTWQRVLGITVILLGLYVSVGRPSPDRAGGQPAIKSAWFYAFPVIAGASYGSAESLRAFGVVEAPSALTAALIVAASGGVVGAVINLWRRPRRSAPPAPVIDTAETAQMSLWRARALATGGGIAASLAILSIMAGLLIGDVAQVSPLVATQPLWLVLLSSLVAAERRRLTVQLAIGAVVVCAGAAWMGLH